MTTNYDPIAEQYRLSKQQPWRTHVESFTLMELVGDPAGRSALDVACGEGYYTRRLRHRGACPVVGIDLSPGMVALAQKQEAGMRQGIEYHVGDARDLKLPAQFDIVLAAYLLNYASTREELGRMCAGIARALKPGGRFVTVNCNPARDFSNCPSYRHYGFETTVAGPWQEGAPITWRFYLGDQEFEIENYHLDVPTHEAMLREAGFREIRWHAPRLSPDGAAEFPADYWETLLTESPISFIECQI